MFIYLALQRLTIVEKYLVINIHPNMNGVVKIHSNSTSCRKTCFWSSFISGHTVSWQSLLLTATMQCWSALSFGLGATQDTRVAPPEGKSSSRV